MKRCEDEMYVPKRVKTLDNCVRESIERRGWLLGIKDVLFIGSLRDSWSNPEIL